MEESKQFDEETRKAEELAEKLASVCVGYSYQGVHYAVQRLYERLQLESVFMSRKANELCYDLNSTEPTPPSE